MIKRLLILILALACLTVVFCACSCNDENNEENTPPTSSSINNSRPDNQNPVPPPLVNKPCEHYWYKTQIDKNTSSTSSIMLKGECYLCGDYLSREAITTVSYNEWKDALSLVGLNSFTVFNSNTYTDYTENSIRRWKIASSVFTEEFFINSENNNASTYVKESFSGYALMYNSFVYSMDTRTYIYQINDQSHIELGFADSKLVYHATVTKDGHNTQKSETLYLNHGKIDIEIPTYFDGIYNKATSKNVIEGSTLSASMANSVYEFIRSLKFEGSYEISFLENGKLSVHFYLNPQSPDPIFNEQYTSATVVIDNDKLEALVIGTNSIELDY
jgi:hypothetical protein